MVLYFLPLIVLSVILPQKRENANKCWRSWRGGESSRR